MIRQCRAGTEADGTSARTVAALRTLTAPRPPRYCRPALRPAWSIGGSALKCPRCQHENRSGAKFCEECAAPLARACTNCGAQLSATAKFCSECAHPAGPAAPSTPQRFRAPEAYTPKHLAEKILTSKTALEGERKQVTVLFADLKGSMELLADRDPEEARKLLDPVIEHMMEAVHRYEGTVNQVMGDGIMALFGAPVAHEDHAVRACYAALRMRDQIRPYAEQARREHGALVHVRVGVNSGEVVVRSVGSDLRMDYTAVGQTTHLAARMEQMAEPDTVLITPDTLRLAQDFVRVQSLGALNVKGLPTPLETFALVSARPVRSRLQAAAARGFTKFVGRDPELAYLNEALEQAKGGRGQLVAVVAEAGVGKSRLFWEFTHSDSSHSCLVLEANSVSYGKATPYLPVIDMLRRYFQIQTEDGDRKISDRIGAKLLALDPDLMPILPDLVSLLGGTVDDPAWRSADPAVRRRRTLDGVRAVLLRESQVDPLIVIFEDLHWIDGETQAMLDSLVESLPAARMVLLVNYRPEYTHRWASKSCYRQLRLDPLAPESTDELLTALLGDDAALGPLKRILVERSGRNPFILEESVQELVETGALEGERGAYRLIHTPETVRIPATAQTILAARIDRLGPDDKRLLQVAAVIGKDVPLPLLQAVAGEREDVLRTGLGRLRAAEFLYEVRLFPEVELSFKHTLTHEVAYGGLLHEQRRELHARIVGAIEELYVDRLPEHIERLGYHASRGALWEKAASYLRQAAAKAMARSANREALAFLEGALAALANLPESFERIEQTIDLRLDIRSVLVVLTDGHFRNTRSAADSRDSAHPHLVVSPSSDPRPARGPGRARGRLHCMKGQRNCRSVRPVRTP